MTHEKLIGLIIIMQLIIHIAECFHDYHVIEGQNFSEVYHNKKWHFWDSITWTLVHALIAMAAWEWILVLTGLAWRWILLQVVLNPLRGLYLDHLGSGTIDVWTSKLTKQGALILKFVLAATMIFYAGFKIFQGVL